MKNIDQIVDTLSNEEKSLFHDLIEECREREVEITKSGANLAEDLSKLSDYTNRLIENIEATHEASEELALRYQETLDSLQKICLQVISDDKFYHA